MYENKNNKYGDVYEYKYKFSSDSIVTLLSAQAGAASPVKLDI